MTPTSPPTPATGKTALMSEAGSQAEVTHNDRCCMEGAWPGWGPHPDCPGVEALNEAHNRAAEPSRCDKALDTPSEVCPRCFRQHAWLMEN
jgi:hypothetical protein